MALAYSTSENREILQVAEAVAREKGIDREVILDAMEQAIQVAGRRKYGHELNVAASIDRKTGEISLRRQREVVEEVENPSLQISLTDARHTRPDAEIGSFITDPLPPIDFNRIAAQTAKQVIMQRVRDAEREKQYEEFKHRVGDVISAVVKRVEFGNVYVEVSGVEAVIRREDLIPREVFKPGERVRAYVYDVRRERTGPQIFLSRTHPIFMAKLFAQEVPEIYDGVIEIKAVARDPGSRAKIAVLSHDNNIDPVGSCVGVRGSRVQPVIQELQGEKIDILPWSADPAVMVVKALQPADVSRVVVDESSRRLQVAVPNEMLSQAIGRRGQNVRLASELVGWEIDVMTEEEESKLRVEEFSGATQLFADALNVEDVIAELLVSEGFRHMTEIAEAAQEDIAGIEGFDEEVAAELIRRAQQYLQDQQQHLHDRWKELKIAEDMLDVEGMTMELAIKLAEQGVTSRDDLADLARDEFQEKIPDSGMRPRDIDALIMKARSHWFQEETEADAEKQSGAA